MQSVIKEGAEKESSWEETITQYQKAHPDLAEKLNLYLNKSFPENWDGDLPTFTPEDGPIATRAINSNFLNAVSGKLPWLIGGSADLEPSTRSEERRVGNERTDQR